MLVKQNSIFCTIYSMLALDTFKLIGEIDPQLQVIIYAWRAENSVLWYMLNNFLQP